MASRKAATPKIDSSKAPRENEMPAIKAFAVGCEKVWHGNIGRLRIYDQPASTGKKVFVYLAPGANSDYVGYTDDPNMIKAVFLARDNGRGVQGYTNASCRIEWMDY